jgi:hypothetical protein
MDKMPKWISQTTDGILIRLQIQPKAARTEVSGEYGDRLKIRIAAPPVDGAANEELIQFLKKQLGIPASKLHLVRGDSSRAKDVLLVGVSIEQVITALFR